MDRSLYVAASGGSQTMVAQAIHSNNIANVNTTGFRADLQEWTSKKTEGESELDSRVFSKAEQQGVSTKSGAIVQTGRPLDVAIEGNGWIAVQAKTGEEAYTRAGDFQINASGLLVTGTGLPVLGSGGPISISTTGKIEISNDGAISVIEKEGGKFESTEIGRLKLVNPDPKLLKKGEDGLIRHTEGTPQNLDPNVKIISGALEGSNVSAMEELTKIISLSRQFEMQVKLMHTLKENESKIDQVLQP